MIAAPPRDAFAERTVSGLGVAAVFRIFERLIRKHANGSGGPTVFCIGWICPNANALESSGG
jgi:hypothetical protein